MNGSPHNATAHERSEPARSIIHAELDAEGTIDAWLNVLVRMLRVAPARRQLIRAELKEHLTERVRDLLLSGCPESEAVRTAIAELGETAHLARRFEAANRPRIRRLLMHLTLAAVTSGLVALGTIMIAPQTISSSRHLAGGATTMRGFTYEPITAAVPAELEDTRIALTESDSLRTAVQTVMDAAKVGIAINWSELEQYGVSSDAPIGLSFTKMPVNRALDLITHALGDNTIGWRMREEGIEIGVNAELDRRDAVLASYDISDVIATLQGLYNRHYTEAVDDIVGVLTQMVESDSWKDNGGDIACMNMVGGMLFIQAPPRMHEQIQWIIDQLKQDAGGAQAKAGTTVPLLGDLPVLNPHADADTPHPDTVSGSTAAATPSPGGTR